MSWNERTPSGTPANFVLTDPRLLKLLARRNKLGDQDPSAPIVNQSREVIAPPQASAAPQEPSRPLPVLPNQPVTDAGTPYHPTEPEPIALPRDFSFNTPRPAFSDDSQLPQLPIEARRAQQAVRDPNSPEGLRSSIEWELAHPAKAPAHRGFLRKLGDIASEAVISMGEGDPNQPLAERLGRGLGAGVVQGVKPDTIYRQRQQSKIGQDYQRLGALNAIQDEQDKRSEGALKRQGEATDIDYKRALIADTLDRPARERLKIGADAAKEARTSTEAERHNKVMEGLTGTTRADSEARAKETERHNKESERIAGLRVAAESGRTQQSRARGEQWRRWNAEKGIVEKRNQDSQREWQDASRAAERFNADKNKLDQLGAERNALNGREDRNDNEERRLAQLNEQLPKEIQRLTRETERLKGNRHLVLNGEERFEVNDRPEPEAYPDLPVGDEGQSAAPQGKQVINAQAYAKDHNISVEAARKLINSTPGYTAGN